MSIAVFFSIFHNDCYKIIGPAAYKTCHICVYCLIVLMRQAE